MNADLKETTPRDPDVAAFNLWLRDFRAESDRAAVILGAAKLDLALYQLLVSVFLPSTTGRDELLDTDQPLSNFSSRINLAYRLGLIDRAFARSLHIIRRIRNDFAHEAVGADLDAGAHRDRVRELAAPFLQKRGFSEYSDRHFSMFTGASKIFRAVLALLVIRLHGAIKKARAISDEDAYDIMPPAWADEELASSSSDESGEGARTSPTHDPCASPEIPSA